MNGRVAALFYAAVFLESLAVSSYLYLVPPYAVGLGASEGFVGAIGSARAAPYSFLPMVFGTLSDVVGRGMMFAISGLVAAASTAWLYSSSDLTNVLLSQVLLGVSFALFFPITEGAVKDFSEGGEELRRNFSIYSVSWALAFIVGAYMGGVLSDLIGLGVTLILSISLAILASIMAFPLIHMLRPHGRRTEWARDTGGRVHGMSWILAAVIFYGFVFSVTFSMLPSLAARRMFTASEIGAAYSALSLTRLVFFMASYRIGSPRGRGMTIITSSLIAFIAFFIVIFSTSPLHFMLGLSLLGISAGLFYPVTATAMLEMGMAGRMMGYYETALGVGFTVGPIMVGMMIDSLGYTPSYMMVAVLALLMSLATIPASRPSPSIPRSNPSSST